MRCGTRGSALSPVTEASHLVQDVELKPAFAEIDVPIRQEIIVTDVDKSQVLQNQSSALKGKRSGMSER